MPRRAHRVLAAVSRGYPLPLGRFPRVTHPSATFTGTEVPDHVRLACVRHAASVRSEPGSNSQVNVRPGPEPKPQTRTRQPELLEDPVTRLLSPSRTPIPKPQSHRPKAEKPSARNRQKDPRAEDPRRHRPRPAARASLPSTTMSNSATKPTHRHPTAGSTRTDLLPIRQKASLAF